MREITAILLKKLGNINSVPEFSLKMAVRAIAGATGQVFSDCNTFEVVVRRPGESFLPDFQI